MKAGKLVFGIVALISVPVMAASAQSVLRQARDDYYKSLKTPTAPEIKQQVTSEETDEDDVTEEKKVVKKKTPIERLQENAAKAAERVDYYQRVVRSVQREEAELGELNSILKKDNGKKTKATTTKTTKKTTKK